MSRYLMKIGFAGLFILAACDMPTGTQSKGFKSEYVASRTALEEGRFDRAVRGYETMLKRYSATQAEGRLRLEYAHALLRGNNYQKASQQAHLVSVESGGALQASALAVRGTAEHEFARARLQQGPFDAATETSLKTALSAMERMLKSHPELDSTGAMANRRKAIKDTLANYGKS
ncbi:hypothetical protein [Tateyamaria sp. SN3-11]|uniref:hypothetical protein n=1 Tax=Tateyamaria sp. SN3-11 TaxID=3092147 RepID=UPI0039E86A91